MKREKNKKIVLASTIVLGIAAITSSALAAYIITGGDNHYSGETNPTDVVIDNKVTSLKCTETDLTLNSGLSQFNSWQKNNSRKFYLCNK